MVKQHKLVTEELKKEIESIHGLQVRKSSPCGYGPRSNALDRNIDKDKYRGIAIRIHVRDICVVKHRNS